MLTAKEIKDFADAQWKSKGVRNAANGNVFTERDGSIRIQAGATREYMSKEARKWRSQFATYNEKLKPIILAEAQKSDASYLVIGERKFAGPIYTWPKEDKAPEAPKTRRRRVSRKQTEQAAAILAKVPQDELMAFLARFGLSLTTCAALVSIGDIEAMAREFLRATL